MIKLKEIIQYLVDIRTLNPSDKNRFISSEESVIAGALANES